MKVAVVGSRGFWDLDLVAEYVGDLDDDTTIVSGGAAGVDTEAECTAKRLGMNTEIYLPDWAGLGKRAGFARNVQIVTACDRLVAFWDGESRGTKHSIDLARKQGKPVLVIGGRA